MSDLRRGAVVWAHLNPARGRDQSGRPCLVIASDLYLTSADTLAIVVPATTTDRGWPNHVFLHGGGLTLPSPTYAMTEQPRVIARERIGASAGIVDVATMAEVDGWFRDFLALPLAPRSTVR